MLIALTDIETLGLNPKENEIIEIACIIFDSQTFEIKDTFESKIKPLYPENADPKAIECNGFTEEEWKDTPDVIPVLQEFCEKTKGCVFCAYNINFDWSFIEYNLQKYGIESNFSYHKICLLSMAFAKIPHDKLFSWSLKTVATYLSVPRENKIHRSRGGVDCEYGVYCALMK